VRNRWSGVIRVVAPLGCLAATAVVTDGVGAQQVGRARVAGVVTDESNGNPLPGVTVRVLGTSFATVSGADGRYAIPGAAAGVFRLEARRIGYGVRVVDNVRLVHDSTTTIDFKLADNPLRLQNVVVTGTVDPTQGVKTPYTVAQLTAADLPVPPNTSAAGAIQGKVAGAQIIRGRGPGAGVNIQLRTPTSQFKTTSPIFVVDGVVLNSTVSTTTKDIETMDIASIEVIKGAAAASLYGSLGANGVVAITTNRGNNLALNTTQFTLRTENGVNQFTRMPPKPAYHQYRVGANGQYVNAAGRDTTRRGRVVDPIGFKDKAYVDPVYDHAGSLFDAGGYRTINLAMSQNLASTNFSVTFNRKHEEGVVIGSNGFLNQTFRVNVDHRRGERFALGISAYHSRVNEDPATVNWGNFFAVDPDVDITRKTVDGRYVVLPDSNSTIVNPLYRQLDYEDQGTQRARTLLSTNASFKIRPWLTATANYNYDRSDRQFEDFIPRGILGTDGQTPTLGTFRRDDDIVEGVNATAGLTYSDKFGALTPRLSVQALVRREKNPYTRSDASDFSVAGVRDLDIGQTRTITSSFTDRRLQSGIVSANLDYADKLIGDFSVQREGNSLYGPASRWNNWYRGSAAYRMAEEAWWPFESVNELKLRYSYGSAGNRPDFSDQYETVSIAAGGLPTRQSFGNRALKPEVSVEQELGIDAIVKNRISLSLVYAMQDTKDNIISMPLPALSGFNTQEQNVGEVRGRTLEATIQAQLVQYRGFSWEMNLVADRSRSRMVNFGRSCYTDGILWRCDGSQLDEMWGNKFVYTLADLPAVHRNSQGAFQVNDDGFVVAVGQGNSWTDGVAKNLWGSTVRVDGRTYAWGRPILMQDSLGNALFTRIGRSLPDANFGFGNTLKWRNLRLYGLVTGQVGGQIYNNIKQALYQSTDHVDVVQAGKPDERKKPVTYYTAADGVSSNNGNYNSFFVETGTYAKLSELAITYQLPTRAMRLLRRVGADRASVELLGRNLALWTKYTGIDPEAGTPAQRIDDALYPLYRVWTGVVNLTF